MAKYLIEKGHSVTMVFGRSPRLKSPLSNHFVDGLRRGVFEGINLIELDIRYNNKYSLLKRAMIFFSFAFRSIRLVFTEKYDVVFATTTPLTAGIPGIVMKLFGKKKPFVFEVRDLWPELPREMGLIKNKFVLWLMEILEYLSYNSADVCVALSPGIKQGIERRLKRKKPVFLIPNGSDLQLFRPGQSNEKPIPGCTENDFIAIFTGAHGIANGLDAALDAASVLKQKGIKHIKLVFVGDGKKKAHLLQRAAKEQLDNCIFLSPVPKKELVCYLQAADIGMMLLDNIPAFYYGTSPNKFFDYISVGMPILNNYPGWLAEMIEENNLGKVIPPENPKLFAEALIVISNDRDNLKIMGANARRFAEENFNRKNLAEKFTEALSTAMKMQLEN